MRTCELCEQWAQWKAQYPDRTVRIYCHKHKEVVELEQREVGIKFVFVGVIPSGIDYTQLGPDYQGKSKS